MLFGPLFVCASAIVFHLVFPSQTEAMLREWEAAHSLEIIAAQRCNNPWTLKWGWASQAQKFVRVLVRDTHTGERSEMILCLGHTIFGLKIKRVRICEIRTVEARPGRITRVTP
ncbi:hypothetical protein [Methylobacterium frigidaeris]|uniref:Uncharacterized protein n=1 Tax=Methylobacterium frigidaeris TaxID=2038277 RepID=A0AA37H928_9HYPH|nr:hypothetical protein [Methylobacterium frigidaeris]GJD61683.1 hypothetical protein MPEAHAMD_1826 [Methylobacterium frigidaeris]